jgi:hypothetical protein
MTLTAAITEATGTAQERLAQVRARTVSTVGRIPGAELGGVLLSFGVGLVSFITDKAAATGTSSIIRDICIGLCDRFKPDGEVDFSVGTNVALIDAFLADAEVAALLDGIPAAYVKAAILDKASATVPEFPSVTLRDVLAVTDPDLVATEYSNSVQIIGISQKLKLTTAASMPEPVSLRAEVSTDGIVWIPIATSMLEYVAGATVYPFRVTAGPMFIEESRIRVVSPYTVGLSLA